MRDSADGQIPVSKEPFGFVELMFCDDLENRPVCRLAKPEIGKSSGYVESENLSSTSI